jgi:hypothetical protein
VNRGQPGQRTRPPAMQTRSDCIPPTNPETSISPALKTLKQVTDHPIQLVDLFTIHSLFGSYFEQLAAITVNETTILRSQRFNIAISAILAGKLYL